MSTGTVMQLFSGGSHSGGHDAGTAAVQSPAAEVAVRRGTEVQLTIAGRPGHRGPSDGWLSVTLQPPFTRFAALKSIHLAKHFGKIGEDVLGVQEYPTGF